MTAKTYTLPWPPKGLSPNARTHWSALARSKKAYRTACAWTAKEQGAKALQADRLLVHMRFVPPDRRLRDMDNLIASMKAGLDGLADVLGVDDRKWSLSFDPLDATEIGGFVRVSVEAIE